MTDSKNIDTVPNAEAVMSETPNAPSGPDGTVHGSSSADVVTPTTDTAKPSTADAERASGHPGASGLGPLPQAWCSNPKCNQLVQPVGRGTCPRCGRTLRLNYLSRRNPVRRSRVEELTAVYSGHYQPTSPHLIETVATLAAVTEQREQARAGTVEYGRLVDDEQKLFEVLNAARRAPVASDAPDYANESDDALIEKLERLLSVSRAIREAKATTPSSAPMVPPMMPTNTPAPTPEPEPEQCPYCRRSTARCRELHDDWLEKWRALHSDDPTEVERTRYAAHQEMIESLRRQRRGY